MNHLADVIETVWRAICHYLTYTPEQLSIAGVSQLWVVDDYVLARDRNGAANAFPVADLDLRFAATISPTVFPLT